MEWNVENKTDCENDCQWTGIDPRSLQLIKSIDTTLDRYQAK